MEESSIAEAKVICDRVLVSNRNIRHVGYYDTFGKVLCDSSRANLEGLKGEGLEEMHILNGTAASTLVLWNRADFLLGALDALIMIREKVVDLIVPHGEEGAYFLVVFDKGSPTSEADEARLMIKPVKIPTNGIVKN